MKSALLIFNAKGSSFDKTKSPEFFQLFTRRLNLSIDLLMLHQLFLSFFLSQSRRLISATIPCPGSLEPLEPTSARGSLFYAILLRHSR